ncbi:MAG: hypothetical protein A3I11_06890 [Elusimicrobia bacterium RIFCSPLOWO2_02_FULL_39_32]|nr:MAG: hypothetical protein A2034_02290 [Elusimicrobia bacterium GWA2_38_7]OGR81129.1 MAG: hypothetical protein A3B80_03745 [Elusimicrobia bacterium RIFCSPHIGHO2_02_FULL_39_36]OGR91017.1 MAG: hypothetical protein A3I11_06890 [Elusimicrobia bacterium RIFCSPLOWO2_02_FULL_39_32]OGR98325.1 MAG: hypothetical protein A3G85_07655 [Elusimicrobia bacterium RIFCSPLOWO2_12_FULL_39_28]
MKIKPIFNLEGKYSLISFRFIILLLLIFFMLYGQREASLPLDFNSEIMKWILIIASIHIGSNFLLFFIPNQWITKSLSAGLFFFDTILISLALYKIQGFESDIFLVYFLVVFMTVIARKPSLSFLVSGLACLLYGFLFLKNHSIEELMQPEVMIRFPLLLVVAFFSSIIVYESEKTEFKAVFALYEMSKALFSKLKLENLLPLLVEHSLKLLKADDISIMLLDQDKNLFLAAATPQPHFQSNEHKKTTRMAIGERVAGKVAEWQESVLIVGPLANDPRFSGIESREEIHSSLIYPLLSKTDILGVLCATRTKNKIPFNQSDQQYADIFVSLVSQAIDNARLYQELEQKIEMLDKSYKQLSDTQYQLIQSEKLSGIGQLAAGVAHELNNPLTSVIGLVDLLLSDEGEDDPLQKKEDLKIVREQAVQCSRIISHLLQFSKKHPPHKELSSINQILEKTLTLVQYKFKSEIKIIKELDATNPLLRVDPYQIQQVFINILNNAYDALKGKLEAQVMIKTTVDSNKINIIFKDNGTGISESNIRKIFDPFFTTKEVGKGTGLGLSVSYGIIKEHGGDILVNSKVGEGSEFIIQLPA